MKDKGRSELPTSCRELPPRRSAECSPLAPPSGFPSQRLEYRISLFPATIRASFSRKAEFPGSKPSCPFDRLIYRGRSEFHAQTRRRVNPILEDRSMIRPIHVTLAALLAVGTAGLTLAQSPATADPFADPAAATAPAAGEPPAAELPRTGFYQPDQATLAGRLVLTGQKCAGAGAKYSKLLRSIEVPQDQETYGDYYDWGYYTGTSWAGFNDLPPGYWVYVAPKWHIFEKCRENAAEVVIPVLPNGVEKGVPHGVEKRSWGPEQPPARLTHFRRATWRRPGPRNRPTASRNGWS